jgi:hypothetical protein
LPGLIIKNALYHEHKVLFEVIAMAKYRCFCELVGKSDNLSLRFLSFDENAKFMANDKIFDKSLLV